MFILYIYEHPMKKLYQLVIVSLVLLSCNNQEKGYILISEYDKQILEYFPAVTLGFDNSTIEAVTRKWAEEMKVYMYGNVSSSNLLELENVRDEINQLASDGFSISIVQDSTQANFFLFLGSSEEYVQRIPFFADLINGFTSYYYLNWNTSNQIRLSWCFVDVTRLDIIQQNFYIRSVITRSLGFTRFSYLHYESIFSDSPWNGTDGYADIDRDLIRLMYHPDMKTGLSEGDSLNTVLLTILMNEK